MDILLLLDVAQHVITPPPSPAEALTSFSPKKFSEQGEQAIEQWIDQVQLHTKAIDQYSASLDVEVLTYFREVILCQIDGVNTNVAWICDQASLVLRDYLPKLQNASGKSKELARLLNTTRHSCSKRATLATSGLSKALDSLAESLRSIQSQSRRVIGRASSMITGTKRSLAVYQNAVALVLRNEEVEWEARDLVSSDPSECYPWIEIKVSKDVRRDRAKLRKWEKAIAQAVKDSSPSSLGTVGINYSTIEEV